MSLLSNGLGALRANLTNLFLWPVLLLIAVANIRPAGFRMPSAQLDPSWMTAVSYGTEKGFAFGTDIVFTAGPFSSFHHRMYDHTLAPAIIALDCIWVLVFVGQLRAVFSSRFNTVAGTAFSAIFLTLVILLSGRLTRDGLMLFTVFASVYLYSINRFGTLSMLASILVAAAYCSAKFSILVLALPSYLIADVLSLSRREAPYKAATLILCLVAIFVATGQSPSGFPGYLQGSLEVTSGYSAAMSVAGSTVELIVWLATCLVVLAVFSVVAWPALHSGGVHRLDAIAQFLLLTGYLFVALKAGFVRHDDHSLTSWIAIFMVTPIVGLGYRNTSWMYLAYLFPLVAGFLYLFPPHEWGPHGEALNPTASIKRSIANLETVGQFVRQPRRWMAEKELEFNAAQERLRLTAKLPGLSGSVDVIPSRQGEVIAAGLDYRPRPTVQEYTTYSSSLIARNRTLYSSPKAPDYVIFAPGSIDGRHPASAEGALWPLFLQYYRPLQRWNDTIVLEKRTQPLADILKTPLDKKSRRGERFDVPTSTAPLFVKINVQYSMLGHLANLLFKPPEITLAAIYENRTPEFYRLIPGIAREGAILVPTIKKANGFLKLYSEEATPDRQPRPVAFMVIADRWSAWAYKSEVLFSFAEIDTGLLAKADDGSWKSAFPKVSDGLLTIVDSNPQLGLAEPDPSTGIFAHAPSELMLPTAMARSIDVGFGIGDGAWQGANNVRGVCFSIVADDGQTLFKRCLDPKSSEADRGPQSAHVSFPSETRQIKLIASCVEICSWAWSYWNKADLALP